MTPEWNRSALGCGVELFRPPLVFVLFVPSGVSRLINDCLTPGTCLGRSEVDPGWVSLKPAQTEKPFRRLQTNYVHTPKSIRLSEKAYDRPAVHKEEDEIFSDIVLRLAGGQLPLDLAWILDGEEADATRNAVAERRRRRTGNLETAAT